MEEKTEIPMEVSSEPIYINYDNTRNSDGGILSVLFIQFTLCIIMLLLVFVLNISGTAALQDMSALFKEYSCRETEDFYVRAADAVISYIYD